MFAETQTCDDEFSFRRLSGDLVGSPALVNAQVSLLDTTQNENERTRIRRQEFNALRRGELNAILQPTAQFYKRNLQLLVQYYCYILVQMHANVLMF